MIKKDKAKLLRTNKNKVTVLPIKCKKIPPPQPLGKMSNCYFFTNDSFILALISTLQR